MNFINKGIYEYEYESVQNNLPYGLVNNTSQIIQVGLIGAIYGYDRNPHGYYRINFKSSPYTLQQNKR